MLHRALSLTVLLLIAVGCRDGPSITTSPLGEGPPAPPLDLSPVREILADPLVYELIGGLSNQATAETFQDLVATLATPPAHGGLDAIHWTFGQWTSELSKGSPEAGDEIERAVLGIIVEEARDALIGLERKKGS